MLLMHFMLLLVLKCMNLQHCHGESLGSIRIRGHEILQAIPTVMTAGWRTWTFEMGTGTARLMPVETAGDANGETGETPGWVNPSSLEALYLPQDLPIPAGRAALGVGLHNGVPRCIHTYIRTCLHKYLHIYIHAWIRTCIHACIHTYIRTCIHAYIQYVGR